MKPLERLLALAEKEERLVLGLSSGTSADGVDIALVRIRGAGFSTAIEVVAGTTCPYPSGLKEAVLGVERAEDVCRLNMDLGRFFADAALEFLAEAGHKPEEVDLVGSHGQTVHHIPRGPRSAPSTLQIGEPDVIRERMRILVVADFRTRDVAAGGEGAPLVPYVDYLLFRPERGAVVMLNIGGIANATLVTPVIENLVALDTGPGNAPLDELTRILTRGEQDCDEGGRHAARGRVDESFLEMLLAHPYLLREPPKSTGRETFGRSWVMQILEGKGNLSVLDVLATMTLFTARSIHGAWRDYLRPRAETREVVVSGGGLKNHTLLAHLRRLFHPIPVWGLEEKGYDPDLKEAVAFAILANEAVCGNPSNVPTATGAKWPVVLGKICP